MSIDDDSPATWQNCLVRIAFLVTSIGTIVILVFVILVLSNASAANPGAVVTPVVLASLVAVLVFLTGIAIERESVKHRLPRVRVRQVVIAFLVTVIVFALKSFMFGASIFLILLMGSFLFKEFDSRLRCVAVCGVLMCLTIAEATRRSGGYDSGGVARWTVQVYSFSAFFFPGVLIFSTLKRLATATTASCFGFPVLLSLGCLGFGCMTLHSGIMLCASMSTVLDNTFTGKNQTLQHEYCIQSTISSPLGLVVETFQTMMFPPYEFSSTTPSPFPSNFFTSTTTTTFDCSLLGSIYDDINDTDINSTNGTTRTLDGVDLSHCFGQAELITADLFDPNSTTSTTTATTSTSTTSTSTTSTSTTSTTSTTTTSTTTSTTTTTTSTTSTSTTETTTTDNATIETTTGIATMNSTSGPKAFLETQHGEYCPYGYDVTQEEHCRQAAVALGMTFDRPWNGAGEHKNCLFADDNRLKVYFNFAQMPSPRPNPLYKSLCWRVAPIDLIQRCAPGSADTKVSNTGYWAIAIIGLAGVWLSTFIFVVLLVFPHLEHEFIAVFHAFFPDAQVHPEPDDYDPSDPDGLRALEGKVPQKPLISKPSKGAKLKTCCKRMCHVILMSTQTVIGTAIFAASGIALAVTGLVQLPMTKPPCAKEPLFSPLAWAEEPPERFAVVWCEDGYVASVLLCFLAFCSFLLAFSMSLRSVLKLRREERVRTYKLRSNKKRSKDLKDEAAREAAASKTAIDDEEDQQRDYGAGFRLQNLTAKEACPAAIFADYDGRIFEA